MERNIRIVALGNELLAGVGDSRALGWFGRVMSKTHDDRHRLQHYVLAMPGEGTEALSHRWRQEAMPRFSQETENYLVLGLNDSDGENTGSSARSRLNLANVLDRATQENIKTFVVGPLPGLDAERNQRVSDLNAAYQDVATRRSHYYVDTCTPLIQHSQWRADLAANDGVPGQAGYGLIAWLVLHRGWYDWLGMEEPLA